MRVLPLSWSRISTFLRCQRRFYYQYVLNLKQPETVTMLIGKQVHAALEEFIRSWDENSAMANLDGLEGADYETARLRFFRGKRLLNGFKPVAVEIKFGLTERLEPTGFDAEDCFFRGIIDMITKTENGFEVWDWKTGWSSPDPRQVFSYALALNQNRKKVSTAGYLLLASGGMNTYQIGDEELDSVTRVIFKVAREIEQKEEGEDFPKNLTQCSSCPFRERCFEDGESLSKKLVNAQLMREEANATFTEAKKVFKETEEPIPVSPTSAYGATEKTTFRISSKGDKLLNARLVASWLLENGGEEFIKVSPSLPIGFYEKMPDEIRLLCEWKTSIKHEIIPYVSKEVRL